MATRTEHGAGTFCWINHSTPDPDGAKDFYAELFGWEYEDRDGFWMAQRYEANVAAIYPQEEREREQGLGPHWNNYVSVSDTDAAVARAGEVGGSVFEAPFDVTDAGRTAVLLDPAGAMFWVWQPRRHIGAGHVNDVGCLAFNELSTNDPGRAVEFYSSLFGWGFEELGTGDEPRYWAIRHEPAAMGLNGGLRELSEVEAASEPPIWIPYFTVESVAAAVRTATSRGGRVHRDLAQVEDGTLAMVRDPSGAVVGLFEGEVDD